MENRTQNILEDDLVDPSYSGPSEIQSLPIAPVFTLVMAGLVVTIVVFRLFPAIKGFLIPGSISGIQDRNRHLRAFFISLIALFLLIPFIVALDRGFLQNGFSLTRLSGTINDSIGYQASPKEGITPSNNQTTSGSYQTLVSLIIADEARVRTLLKNNDIGVNKGGCSSYGSASCTSVGAISDKTLSLLFELKRLCNCPITVTGGTEWWLHGNRKDTSTTAHGPGNTGLDLARTTVLTNYIYRNFPKANSKWNICTEAFEWNGFYFCDEKSDHWHIQLR